MSPARLTPQAIAPARGVELTHGMTVVRPIRQPAHAPDSYLAVEPLSWTRRGCDGRGYVRAPLRVRWLRPEDDLAAVLSAQAPLLRPGDTLAVSEKVAVLLSGHTVSMADLAPGRFARALARLVRPRQGSRGLSVPEKMQYVLHSVGVRRVVLAVVASALTRPIGVRGLFYRVAGGVARDVDGGRPPYEDVLFPPLEATVASRLCADLERAVGVGVAIVDINDFGGCIRATSPSALAESHLFAVLADTDAATAHRYPVGGRAARLSPLSRSGGDRDQHGRAAPRSRT